MPKALLVFVDGVGLGNDDPETNPLAAADLPSLSRLLDGRRPVGGSAGHAAPDAILLGLDACLGHPGLPQSGTGQATLLTGENAAAAFGRHFGPWTPTALRPLVERRSLLMRAVDAGLDAAFANAYPEEVMANYPAGRDAPRTPRLPMPLRTGPVIAARAAGLLTRHTPHLSRGEAVATGIVNDAWRESLGRVGLPVIDAASAGRNLAAIADRNQLTFFAHYDTDIVGHRGTFADGVAALVLLDRFIGGIIEGLPADCLLLVVSDHGNIEDIRRGHTRNPALALIVGGAGARGAPEGRESRESFARQLHSLLDVAPALLGFLGVNGAAT